MNSSAFCAPSVGDGVAAGRKQGVQQTVGESLRRQPVDEQGLQEGVGTDVAKRGRGMRVLLRPPDEQHSPGAAEPG